MAGFSCGKEKVLDKHQKMLEKPESLVSFYKEEYPWLYDRETGDLYEYDDFEEALIPIRDLDYSSDDDPYNRFWVEYSSTLSKDGKKLKIRMLDKVNNVLLGERIEGETIEIYDIESNTAVYNPGKEDEKAVNCIEVPTAGIDVQWADDDVSS